jgi:hypothetical protein
VFVIKINSSLSSLVTNYVAMSEILGDDTRSWLLLLCNLIAITASIAGEVASIILTRTRCAANLYLRGTKLCVVEEKGGLSGGLFLEGDCRGLSLA